MKSLVLSAAVAAMGITTLAEDASAEHRSRRGRRGGFDLRIGGSRFGIAISTGRSFGRRGIVTPGRFRGGFVPGPPAIIVPDRHYHVRYHMHGTQSIHTHSHAAAHRYERMLERYGFHAKVIHNRGHYDVVYHMHGTRSRTFGSHAAAHAFERQLERLGAHARVVHH